MTEKNIIIYNKNMYANDVNIQKPHFVKICHDKKKYI